MAATSISASIVLLSFFIVSSAILAAADKHGVRGIHDRGRKKTTHLQFYFQELSSGPNMSVVRVAQTNTTDATPASFGAVSVADNPLTEGPELSSKLVGRVQGMYAAASQEQFTLLLALNFVFTEGKYNGSVLTMVGRNPVFESVREVPVLGGTGYFRLARGYALLRTYRMDQSTGLVTVGYNVTHERGIHLAEKKTTQLHFYFQEISAGPNPSVVLVAKANTTDASPSSFGSVFVADNPLTEGPELTSKPVGRAQGMYAAASQEEFATMMSINFVLTEGEYNGSVLTMLGRNPIAQHVREMPIIGGSGYFRLAWGYAVLRTHKLDPAAGLVTVEYNVTVIHP
ncbi:hypothetical protein Taro_047725 [Colocasia esculenta]|uniref:Dirigent protein n=1 Tax=Colocasia esculenta TaxID=4460 RepID=A0A843WW74_COLES|nr:hypothetical protein [Colocasia esculenta]